MTLTMEECRLFLREDLTSFIEFAFDELNPQTVLKLAPYIEIMASKLEDCRLGKIKRLIINVPPRHLKSHCASISFVAWLLGHNPALHVICVSYGQDFADKLARDCRQLMTSSRYLDLFPTRLSDRQAVHDFATTDNGTRMATSIGGVLTGRGADFIIIDDPQKPDETLSENGRKNANGWFDNSLRSRLNDKTEGCIIIVMQRLHQDDLVGHVQEHENWEVLSFPAIAVEEETFVRESPLGKFTYKRQPGDLLDPARENLTTLNNMRQSIGEYNFESQYQQSPIPIGGNIIKVEWLRFYDKRPEEFAFTLLSLDTANKAKELNDYSVATIWGYLAGKYYLIHVFRRRLEYPDLKHAISQLVREYSVAKILIEDQASGTQLLQDFSQDGMFGLEPYTPPARTDKILRLHAQSIAFEQGLVFLPKEAAWLEEYLKELTGCPGTKYDDQVDSTTQALDYMRNKSSMGVWARLAQKN